MSATRAFRLLDGLSLALLLAAACAPEESKPEAAAQEAVHIDSEIAHERLKTIKDRVTIREFLVALGLCALSDPAEEVLGLIEFHDTESAVNSYSLQGGGGVHFTTRIHYSDDEATFDVYSPRIWEDVVTSFDYSVNGTIHFASLSDGKYLTTSR